MAPTAALKVAIAVKKVEFALIIALVVVLPPFRRAFVGFLLNFPRELYAGSSVSGNRCSRKVAE